MRRSGSTWRSRAFGTCFFLWLFCVTPHVSYGFGSAQWEWKAQGVSETFSTKEEALAALQDRGGDYAFLDQEAGVYLSDAQWTYYKYQATPRDPVEEDWVYHPWGTSNPSFSTEAGLYAYMLDQTYSDERCSPTLEPDTGWTTTNTWMNIPIAQSRDYKDHRFEWEEPDGPCFEYQSNTVTFAADRDVHCEYPFTPNPSDQNCVLYTTGYIQGRPLVGVECTARLCDVSTGNKTQRESDYSGPELTLERHYHSLLPDATSGFGKGWVHNYSARVIVTGGSPVTLLRPTGFQEPLYAQWVGMWLWASTTGSGIRVEKVGSEYVVFLDSGAKEVYDSSGRLTELVDSSGRETLVSYDSSNRVEEVTGPFGHTLTFEYDEETGRISTVTDPASNEISYAYDTAGNLIEVTYPDATTREYHYEDSEFPNHLTGITDENGDPYKTVTYDSLGRAATSEVGDGFEAITLTYDETSTTVTDALEETTEYEFTTATNLFRKVTSVTRDGETRTIAVPAYWEDPLRRPTQVTDENGAVTKFAFDSNHRTSRTEAFGQSQQRVTSFSYLEDQSERPTLISSPSVYSSQSREVEIDYNSASLPETIEIRGYTPSGTAVSRTITLEYNGAGQVTEIDGPRTDVSDVTTLAYYECTTGDECGQLESVTNAVGHETTYDAYDAHGRLLEMTDPNGVVTEFGYDLRGRTTSITETPPSGPARVTTYTFDDAGQLETVEAPNGALLTYAYNSAHYLMSITDNLGNKIEYDYDLNGNRTDEDIRDASETLVKTIDYAYDARNRLASINAAGSVTDLVFDAVGNLTDDTDPNSNDTAHDYDPLNRLVETLDALSGVTEYGYDKNDYLTSVEAPNGATTIYVYDDLGNLLSMTSPDTGTTTFTHDAAGNVLSQTDANDVTVEYTYDALNRLTEIEYPNSTLDVSLAYDEGTSQKGRLTSMTDGSGTTSFAYDVFGNLIEEERVIDSHTHVTAYTFDAANQLESITYPSGRTVEYTRNVLGQITAIDTAYSTTSLTVADEIEYLPFGPLSALDFGNTLVLVRAFDTQYRLTEQTTGSIQDLSFTLDAAGNIDGIADAVTSSLSQDFTQDALHRIEFEEGDYGTKEYTYDAVGNRLTRVHDDGSPVTQTLTYTNNSNRLATHDGQTVTLDDAGNTTADPAEDLSFTFDDHNRMVEAYVGAVLEASYVYNGQGQRVKKIEATGAERTIIYHYGRSGQLLGETVYSEAGSKIGERDYLWIDSLPIAQSEREFSGTTITSDVFVYLHGDQLNTPRLATDATGEVVWRWDSDAFGVGDADLDPDSDTEDVNVRLRFPGQYLDEETGLHYNYFRDYHPATGRYVQSDPIGLDGGINTFGYVHGNPVAFTDPSGLLDIFVGGFGDRRSQIVSDYQRAFAQAYPSRSSRYFEWDESDEIMEAVLAALAANSCEPINLIGHSLGGSTAARLSRDLQAAGVSVSLLATIDPVSLIRRRFEGAAGHWVNVNAAPSSSNGWAGDAWARVGSKWGNWPSTRANSHYDAPYHHNEFGDLFEFAPMGDQSALQVLVSMPNSTCSSTC